MAARNQLEQMRGRALPPGSDRAIIGPGGQIIVPGAGLRGDEREGHDGHGTGQYL
jgi:hypothetical protein